MSEHHSLDIEYRTTVKRKITRVADSFSTEEMVREPSHPDSEIESITCSCGIEFGNYEQAKRHLERESDIL